MNNLPAIFLSPPSAPLDRRFAICQLEELSRRACSTGERVEIEVPLIHQFNENSYIRSCFLPAGSVIVGKLHRHGHWNWLTKGRVTVFTEAGGVEELQAPCRFWSGPATKRAILVHEDTIWTGEHPSDGTSDLDKLEEDLISPSYTQLGLEDPVPYIKKQLEALCG